MKTTLAWIVAAVALLGGAGPALAAANPRDQVKVEIAGSEVHPGMAPGTYVCSGGHLHVKGTVQNLSGVAVGKVKVAGKALGANGKVLGTATASTKAPVIEPNGKAAVDVEFLTITGAKIDQVKHQELSVVAVGPKP